jgi:hypothetical protein
MMDLQQSTSFNLKLSNKEGWSFLLTVGSDCPLLGHVTLASSCTVGRCSTLPLLSSPKDTPTHSQCLLYLQFVYVISIQLRTSILTAISINESTSTAISMNRTDSDVSPAKQHELRESQAVFAPEASILLWVYNLTDLKLHKLTILHLSPSCHTQNLA